MKRDIKKRREGEEKVRRERKNNNEMIGVTDKRLHLCRGTFLKTRDNSFIYVIA